VKRDMGRENRYIILILLAFLFLTNACQSSYSADQRAEQQKINRQATPSKPQATPTFDIDDFVYISENRRDPFEPIYFVRTKRGTKVTAGEKKQEKKGYELDELKLAGILKTENLSIVMMEDLQGRGISFKKGDYLNPNLWIVDITQNRVVFGYKLKGEIKNFAIDIPRK